MTKVDIFQLEFLNGLLAFALIGFVLVRPWLARLDKRQALLVLAAPHMFRYIGMSFLVSGLVAPGLPASFAVPAAYGDLATGALAIIAFVTVAARFRVGTWIFGLFNVVGLLDLARALPQVEMAQYFDAIWYVPTVLVPALLVTHVLGFLTLFRRESVETVSSTVSLSHVAS